MAIFLNYFDKVRSLDTYRRVYIQVQCGGVINELLRIPPYSQLHIDSAEGVHLLLTNGAQFGQVHTRRPHLRIEYQCSAVSLIEVEVNAVRVAGSRTLEGDFPVCLR